MPFEYCSFHFQMPRFFVRLIELHELSIAVGLSFFSEPEFLGFDFLILRFQEVFEDAGAFAYASPRQPADYILAAMPPAITDHFLTSFAAAAFHGLITAMPGFISSHCHVLFADGIRSIGRLLRRRIRRSISLIFRFGTFSADSFRDTPFRSPAFDFY